MKSSKKNGTVLEDVKVPVRFKISALWAAAMFCYIYGDYFGLYQPGQVSGILDGKIQPLGLATQGVLLGVSVSMAIPSVMIFMSLSLPARASRWLNIIMGLLYTIFVLITMPGAWAFYIFFGTVDIVLTALIVWYAWKWPRVDI